MKSKVVAALLSALVLPGAGQWYLGKKRRALAFLVPALVAGFFYVRHALEDAQAVASQVMGGSVAADMGAISAQLEARPMPGWITAAGIVFLVCWVASIADAWFGRVDGASPSTR